MKRGTPRHPKTYLYAIERSGEIKIGYSTDPQRRLRQLSAVRFEPRLLITIETKTPREDERRLQWIWRDHSILNGRFCGEWFSLSAEEVIAVFETFDYNLVVPEDFSFLKFRRERARCAG